MATTRRTLRLEEQLRDELAKVTDAQARDLVSAWIDAWDEISPDLTGVLLDMLVAGDRVTRTQLLRSTRLRKALAGIADHLDTLATDAGVRITSDLQAVIDAAGGAQASVIDSQLPPNAPELVDLDAWSKVDERQVAAIVERSTEQITSRTKPLSAEAYDAVRRELIRGVASGSNPRETARRIVARAERRFNGGLNRALTIARTETLSAHREAARLGRAQHTDVLAGWRWVTALDTRTCPACIAKHGEVFAADASGPDGHPNCRCSAAPLTKSWAELGFEDLEEPADLLPNARAWFDGLPEADQVAIMGRQRLDLLRAGDVGWDDLATLRHNPDWRDSWQVTPVRTLARKAAA